MMPPMAAVVKPEDHDLALKLIKDASALLQRHRLQREYVRTYEQGHVLRDAAGRIIGGGPYPWQVRFHNLGKEHDERALLANNQGGKSRCGAAEVACHATGWYPDWWEGHRIAHPCEILVSGVTNEELRNICQRQLLGKITEDRAADGTGWIPANAVKKVTFRQCGVPNVVDTVEVRHVSGGISTIMFKSYEQGATKFQGVQFDVAWLDEEPEEQDIFSEIQTRMMVRRGHILFTRTPLFGTTDMVRHFMNGGPGIAFLMVSLDECPHLNADDKARMLARWPEHERATRATGVPMLGEGAVYPIADSQITCAPFAIPDHFRRIVGIDFGIDHPFAAAWIAFDADADVMYLYDAWQTSGQTPPIHAAALKARGRKIPVSWPHDGTMRDKGSGRSLADQYGDHDLNMLGISARIHDDKGGGQSREAIASMVLERMHTGRFKVFSNQSEWLRQKNMYHRKGGKINAVNDDLLSASHYAVMMVRYAMSGVEMDMTRPKRAQNEYNPFEQFERGARQSRAVGSY